MSPLGIRAHPERRIGTFSPISARNQRAAFKRHTGPQWRTYCVSYRLQKNSESCTLINILAFDIGSSVYPWPVNLCLFGFLARTTLFEYYFLQGQLLCPRESVSPPSHSEARVLCPPYPTFFWRAGFRLQKKNLTVRPPPVVLLPLVEKHWPIRSSRLN